MNRQDLDSPAVSSKATLQNIYEPIASDLEAVKRIFLEELHSDDPAVNQLCQYINRYHGKMLRPALLILAGRATGKVTDAHRRLAAAIEMLHVATLIHDDVLDGAQLRRKSQTVCQRWGNQVSVLLGDLVLAKVFDLCNRVGKLPCLCMISQTAQIICQGELIQSCLRDQWQISEQRYLQIIEMKTASLYQLCCRLGAYLSGGQEPHMEHLAEYGRNLGLAFQIIDDLLDISGRESDVGKTLGTDLQQRKPTLPVIHFLQQADQQARQQFREALQQHSPQTNGAIMQLLESTGSLAYCRQQARHLTDVAVTCVRPLPQSHARDALEQVAWFIADTPC